MIQEDFYTGEPVEFGSPITNQMVPEFEAANMASFGAYAYDPGMRQQMITPGGYGYNPGFVQQVPPQNFYGGIGAPPMSQFGNQQPTYNIYRMGNPVFQQPGLFQQPVQQPQIPTEYHIPGINISGQYMPTVGYEKKISELEMEYYNNVINQEAINDVNTMVNNNGSVYGYGYNNGYNYYGVPYANYNRTYNTADLELRRSVEAMQQEAKENRDAFNMNISKLAHNFNRDNLSEKDIRERYEGRTIDANKIPGGFIQTQQDYYEIGRLNNTVPFDNSNVYREHFNKVREEFQKVIPPDSDMISTFENMGVIDSQYKLEEELHRRRDASNLYNSSDNSYKRLIRQKAKERYAAERGIVLQDGYNNQIPTFNAGIAKQNFINNSSLSQAATLEDDGTLNVSLKLPCNVGSHAGQEYQVNSNEAGYDEKRERFIGFINSIPGSIYLDQAKQKKIEEYNYE